MTSTVRPRCFVAMASGHDDTDALYEKSILPVLRDLSVIPVIINRRQDNRDINNQIMEQLNECDFCIADLTYARQSAYFEAGYAQRAVEVIYTVRSDHLGQSQADDLRVHFDLQMKPLIRWSQPDDRQFRTDLEARLQQTVLEEWNRRQASLKIQQTERSTFGHMPLAEQLLRMRVQAFRSFSRYGFTSWTPLHKYSLPQEPVPLEQLVVQTRVPAWTYSTLVLAKCLHVVSLRIEQSLPLTALRDEVGYQLGISPFGLHEAPAELGPLDSTSEHLILASIRPIPETRIKSAMPSLGWNDGGKCYSVETTWSHSQWTDSAGRRSARGDTRDIPRSISVHTIESVKSLPEFSAALESIMLGVEYQTAFVEA